MTFNQAFFAFYLHDTFTPRFKNRNGTPFDGMEYF